MRLLGVLLFAAGSGGVAFATWAMYHRSRPADVLAGVLAPVAMVVALLGLVLIFVPGFLSSPE